MQNTILLYMRPAFDEAGDSGNNSLSFALFVLAAIVLCIMAFLRAISKPKDKEPTLVVSNDGRHAYHSNSPILYSLDDEDDDLEDYIPGLDELKDPDYNYPQL